MKSSLNLTKTFRSSERESSYELEISSKFENLVISINNGEDINKKIDVNKMWNGIRNIAKDTNIQEVTNGVKIHLGLMKVALSGNTSHKNQCSKTLSILATKRLNVKKWNFTP